ncbi:hypothetical protein CEW88_11635 [Alloyangia pacifica]|uniref:Uncharacterized protein n=1 Tax=Alloyangia pacifica TaxID=311180 RepID=A0A2U8HEF8_9RHOB|nr:hypothetical protein [Alloyangia pacifica]AWI84279.1 hypothetical protein CEW88_11635 [Alloyangia pacifica]
MPDPLSYNARAMRELSEAIALAREVARDGAALRQGSARERELAKIAAELGAMIQTLGRDLEISAADLQEMIRAPFDQRGRLN